MIDKDELGVLVQRGDELVEAAKGADPTSEVFQLAAIYKRAKTVNDAIEAESAKLNKDPNLSDQGRIAALRSFAAKEAGKLSGFVDEYLTPREAKIVSDAKTLGSPEPMTPAETRLVDAWLSLDKEKRDEVRDLALNGSDPELARALAKERTWITGLVPGTELADKLHEVAFPGYEDKKSAIEKRAKSLNHTRRYVNYVIDRARGT